MDDQEIAAKAKVLTSTLRLAIIRELPSWDDEGMSPARWAEGEAEPLGNVSYHFNVLADADVLRLVSTQHRRGALEHFYRPGPASGFLIGVLEAWGAV